MPAPTSVRAVAFIRAAVLAVSILICCPPASAQTWTLPFRPVTAEYSTALDRIIFISANPDQVHIFAPETNTDVTVSLPKTPLSLSISLDGLHAAVGHDALISYVNLQTAMVEKTLPAGSVVSRLVLGAKYVYVLSYSSGTTWIDLASGAANSQGVYNGSAGRLHPSGAAIYATQDGLSPQHLQTIDVSTGPVTGVYGGMYHGDYAVCGGVWFSPDGNRAYTGCATAYQANPKAPGPWYLVSGPVDTKADGLHVTTLSGVSRIQSLAESALLGRVAVVPGADYWTTVKDNEVLLYDSAYLEPAGAYQVPDFTAGGKNYQAHAQHVFYNASSTSLYVVSKADNTSGLLFDYAVQVYPLANPPACTPAFGEASAAAPASGAVAAVGITAPPECQYRATTNADWIRLVSGEAGSGNARLTYVTRRNPGGARVGTISIGSQALTISQAAAGSPQSTADLGSTVLAAEYSKALDKVVYLVGETRELHIYDPAAGTDRIVVLPKRPLSLSVGPDGTKAAVGFDGWVSIVDLSTASITTTLPAFLDVSTLVLAGNGYVYAFPRSTWGQLYSIATATGAIDAVTSIYDGRVPRLYADGKAFYTEGTKWDISAGPAKVAPSSGSACAPIWLSEDGLRMFDGCGKVYSTSPAPSLDRQYNGSFSGAPAVRWADHSATAKTTAVIPGNNSSGLGDPVVQLYGDAYLGYSGELTLPVFTVGSASYTGRGRYVFWNSDSSKLIVLEQADPAAKLTNDFASVVYPLDTPAAGCAVTLGATSLNMGYAGGFGAVSVSAGAGCIWRARSNAAWVTIDAGAVGIGASQAAFTVASNNTTVARTATLTVGGQTFTITQSGGTATLLTPASGSTLGESVTFTWRAVADASRYWLDIGTMVGQGDITAASVTATSFTASGLPCDGRTIYLQLWTQANGVWLAPQRYTFQAASICAIAKMTSPASGSTFAGTSVNFTWNGAGTLYWLDVGNTVGVGDLFAGATTALSKEIAGLPCDGRTIHVQLFTQLNGVWQPSRRYSYKAANCAELAVAVLTSPAPASTIGRTVTFTWTAATGADNFWLDVGNSVAKGDLFAGSFTTTSATVNGLPCDGRTLHVQLWTRFAGTWRAPQRYTFTAASNCVAEIISPAPSTTVGRTVTFTWSAVPGADGYWLDVGNSVAKGDLFAGSFTATSATVGGLPCDGRTLHVQLWTRIGATWRDPRRYTFQAASNCVAEMTSPAPGSVLLATSTFSWTPIAGADSYWLDVGSSVGQGDLFAGSMAATSKTVNLPCDGRTIHVQLWTRLNGAWRAPHRYLYSVRNCAIGLPVVMVSPQAGNTISGTVTFSWTPVPGAAAYWLDVGSGPALGNIFAANVGATYARTVSGIPGNVPVYVQLWALINGVWRSQQYVYNVG